MKRFNSTISVFLIIMVGMTLCLFNTTEELSAATKKPGKVKSKTIRTVNKSSSTITVKWKRSKKAKAYKVAYRSGNGKWKYKMVKSNKKNVSATLYRLKSGKKYTIKIKAINGNKSSAWSRNVVAKTKAMSEYHETFASKNRYPNYMWIKRSNGKTAKIEISFTRLTGTGITTARFISANKATFYDSESGMSGTITFKGKKAIIDLKEIRNYYFDYSLSQFIDGLHHVFVLAK